MSNTYGRKVRELQAEEAAERPRAGVGLVYRVSTELEVRAPGGWQRTGIKKPIVAAK